MGSARYQVDGDPRTSGPGFGISTHDDALTIPRRWAAPRTVFVNSMSDLFHARVPDEFIQEVFAVMAETPRHKYQLLTKRPKRAARLADKLPWPANVWMGTSVESQDQAWRVDALREVPAAVRFLSIEPLLGPVRLDLTGIHWVIVGGESGHRARPMDPEWVRDLRNACVDAGVAFFFKQWGGRTPKAGGRTLDDRTWDQLPASSGSSVAASKL
jgi:protein gp37